MPVEMKIICPYCGYDHEDDVRDYLDQFISEEPYETQCICGKTILVHTFVTYSFTASKVGLKGE